MSIERVRAFMRERNMEEKILEFEVSSATVELAAQAVGCEPARIAKTLSFDVNGDAVLIVAAGDAKIDNPAFKAFFHTKAKMLHPDEALTRIGHAVGGVCPFAVNAGVRVYLDESLRRFETVFPACGSASSAIELSIPELEEHAHPVAWVDVCKAWRPEEQSAL
jgi:prolyl-tRNA editing enzyme YbaK/EbsC (Cys-tRNA(Pro) deacylase)